MRGRFSAELEWKLDKVHFNWEEEVRVKENFSTVSKVYSTIGGTYKAFDFFSLGADYTFIYNLTGKNVSRFALDFIWKIKAGRWTFSLKERPQLNHKYGEFNTFQQPVNAFVLKSRAKALYSCRRYPLKPYVFCELRNTLNAPHYDSYEPEDMTYSDIYVNRVRTGAGIEWRLDASNFLDFYGLYDYTYDRVIDAKKDGGLKTITIQPGYIFSIGISYKFRL